MSAPSITVPKFIAVALLAIVAFIVGIYIARPNDSAPTISGLLWPDPPQITAFSLTDMNSKRLTERSLAGKWTLVFFGFTHCPDICPTTLKTLQAVADKLRADSTFESTGQVLFVSVDPVRDTPAALRDYVQYFDPSFQAATGTADELKTLTRQLGIIYTKVSTADPNVYSMDHTASILLIGPALQMLGLFSPPYTAADLVNRIQAIINFSETPA